MKKIKNLVKYSLFIFIFFGLINLNISLFLASEQGYCLEVYTPTTNDELKTAVYNEIANQGNNANLNCIDTTNITDMSHLFAGSGPAGSFNGDISQWDTSNVTNMSYLFNRNIVFNGNISNWDVSNVVSLEDTFGGAQSFNQDIGGWDVSNVTTLMHTFHSADNFDQDISNWNISNVTDMFRTFPGSNMSIGNVNKLLAGWGPRLNNPNIVGTFLQSTRFSDLDSYQKYFIQGSMYSGDYINVELEVKNIEVLEDEIWNPQDNIVKYTVASDYVKHLEPGNVDLSERSMIVSDLIVTGVVDTSEPGTYEVNYSTNLTLLSNPISNAELSKTKNAEIVVIPKEPAVVETPIIVEPPVLVATNAVIDAPAVVDAPVFTETTTINNSKNMVIAKTGIEVDFNTIIDLVFILFGILIFKMIVKYIYE